MRRRFMPPESGSTLSFARSSELDELEQIRSARSRPRDARDRSSGRRSTRFSRTGEFVVEGILLRNDASRPTDARAVGHAGRAEDAQRAGSRRQNAADHPHRRALAGCRWARGSRRPRPVTSKSIASTSDEVAELLHQSTSWISGWWARWPPALLWVRALRRPVRALSASSGSCWSANRKLDHLPTFAVEADHLMNTKRTRSASAGWTGVVGTTALLRAAHFARCWARGPTVPAGRGHVRPASAPGDRPSERRRAHVLR